MNIVEILPRFVFAGAERMVENLINSLRAKGHNVCAVSLFTRKIKITDDLEKSGVKIYYLDKKVGLDFSIKNKLKKIFEEFKPDVVHTHLSVSKYVAPIANKLKIPIIVHTAHSVADKELNAFDKFFSKIFYKKNMLTPIAISETVRSSIALTYKLDIAKIPVVYNGIDLSKCLPKTDYELKENINIIHIGRFISLKNQKLIILAIKNLVEKYPSVRMKFIGGGETFNEVVTLTNELSLENNVEFLGEKSSVYEYLKGADIFILPSIYEGMPMTIIEAMATGLPIVASNVGGIPDIVKSEETALLISPTIIEIEKSLIRLIESEQLREKLGKNAKERSKNFSAEKMADGYLEVFGGKK